MLIMDDRSIRWFFSLGAECVEYGQSRGCGMLTPDWFQFSFCLDRLSEILLELSKYLMGAELDG